MPPEELTTRDMPKPSGEFKIRPFRGRDLPDVYRVEQETFPHPWSRSAFLFLAKSPGGFRGSVFVLEHESANGDTELAGYVCLMREVGLGHILNLAVSKKFRGAGWGEQLLLHALDRFTKMNLSTAVLEVRKSNEAAIELYRKHAFSVHHVEKGYYPDGEDALVMVRPLD